MTESLLFGLATEDTLGTFKAQAYNANSDNYRAGTSKSRFKDDFFNFDTTNNWRVIQNPAGQLITVDGISGGSRYLNINTGLNSGDETILLSKQTFKPPVKFACAVSISQRIVNQEFYIELIGVDDNGNVVTESTFPSQTVNNALNAVGLLWDGATAANLKYALRAEGISELVSGSIAGQTTLASGTTPNFNATAQFEILLQTELTNITARLVNSAASGTQITNRTDYVPDTSLNYAVRIRVKNTGVPASASDFRVHFIRLIDAARLSVDFGMIGGTGMDMLAAPVKVTTMPTTTVQGTSTTTPVAPTLTQRIAAAGTNPLLVKSTAGSLYGLTCYNYTAAVKYLKIYNKATAPTVGTDNPILTIPIPPNDVRVLDFGPVGIRFSTGIGLAMTVNQADNDTVGVAASDLKANLSYV